MKLLDIPLFPLELVLFPQMVLPLRIFEARYRLMINECLKNNTPFGVLLLQEGDSVQEGRFQVEPAQPFNVGTLARITEVAQLEEGGMLITTVGTERFRLLEYRNDKPFMTGDIEIWPDDDQPEELEADVLQETVSRVKLVFEQYLRILMGMAGKRIQTLDIPDEADMLSFVVPNWLYISTQDKQMLLEAPGLRTRLETELQLLETETNFLKNIKAKTNQPATPEAPSPGETNEAAWKESNLYNLRDRFSSN